MIINPEALHLSDEEKNTFIHEFKQYILDMIELRADREDDEYDANNCYCTEEKTSDDRG